MVKPLMPKATAVWLTDNTTLTFQQIADFVELHELEVQAIADGEVAPGMQGLDPIVAGQLTAEEIKRCEADPGANLKMAKSDIPRPKARPRGARYTPVSKRADKPDAIEFLLKTYEELSDAQIGRLLGTTKPTIQAVRDRTHWNAQQLKARSPVELGLCSLSELDVAVTKARRAAERAAERQRKEAAKAGGGEAEASAPEGEAEAPAPEGEAEASAPEGEAEAPAPEAEAEASAPETEATAPEAEAEAPAVEPEAEAPASEAPAESSEQPEKEPAI